MIDLTGIISISGQPGLFKIVAQSKNGIIVEGLSDKKRTNIYASTKVSTLSDISMFTTGDDKTMASYFAEVLPDYDKERVYVSNIRKLLTWYNALHISGNLKEKEEVKEGEEKSKATKGAETKAAAKKTAKKDTAKAKTSVGVKKTTGVRKTGTA